MVIRFHSKHSLKHHNLSEFLTLEFLVAYAWILPVVIEAVSGLAGMLIGNTTLVTMALYMVLFLGILVHLSKLNYCFSYVDLGIFSFFSVSILGTLVFFPENTEFIQARLAVWPNLILYFVIGKLSRYTEGVIRWIYKASKFGIVFGLIAYYIVFGASGKDMTLAYIFLPCLLGVITGFFYEKKVSYLVLSVFGLWLQFLLGTRGPLLFVILYTGYQFFFYCDNWKKKILLFASMALAFVLIQENVYMPIVNQVNKFLLSKGIKSEILFLFTTHNTASIDIRGDFYNTLLNISFSKPFAIHGLCGDYVVGNVYAHNIIIEVIFEYGLIIGTSICVVFFAWLSNIFFKCYKNRMKRDLYVLVACGLLLKFFLSGSFFGDLQFCFALAFLSALWDQVKCKKF